MGCYKGRALIRHYEYFEFSNSFLVLVVGSSE
jgi:hypothetical protein